MNTFWKDVPFLRILIPFMVGVCIFLFFSSCIWWPSFLCLVFSLIGMIVSMKRSDFYNIKYPHINGACLQIALISAGYLSGVINSVSFNSPQQNKVAQFDFALIKISEDPQKKPKTIKSEVDILELFGEHETLKVNCKALIYFKQSNQAKNLKQGDYILVKNKFDKIKSNGNPGEFDYTAYCASKHIFQSAFLNECDWRVTSYHEYDLHTFFTKLGELTRKRLQENIKDSTALGIAEALLIGYRNDIDQNVWQAYSNAGIVHIIAISGMHMAMIYMSAQWLLSLIPFVRRKRILVIGIAILCMWLFAGITGLPPSVTRAAIMFSLLGIGELLDRNSSGLNNLAASAFLLLCINPFWIKDVGFQLSYLAVLSIMIFYSTVYNWCFIPNRYIDAVWKLIAGTIAAQILTLPLCIYYFHQFPLLFILTNLIAIPATTLILYSEIVLIAFSWIKPLAAVLGSLISHAIEWLNNFISFTANLSFAVWSQLHINIFQLIVFYAFVIAIGAWLMSKKKYILPVALSCLFVLLCSFTVDRIHVLQQTKMIIYNVPKQKAIEFIRGEIYYSADGDSVLKNKSICRNILQPAHLFYGVKSNDSCFVCIKKSGRLDLFQVGSKLIARVKRNDFSFSKALRVDYLIISEHCQADPDWIRCNFIPTKIILDSSIPSWKNSDFRQNFNTAKLPLHIVSEDGAFEVGL